MPRLRAFSLVASLLLLVAALSAGAFRVAALEREELDERSDMQPLSAWAAAKDATSVSARLLTVQLRRDEHASFEVCSEATPPDDALRGALSFVVWRPGVQKLELSVPLNDKFLPLLKRDGARACLVLGGGLIEHDDRYALDAVWGRAGLTRELAALRLRGRVLAKRPLGRREGLIVAAVALGALGAVLSLYAPARGTAPRPGPATLGVVAGAVLAAAVAFTGLLYLPLPGARGGLVRGLLVASTEIAVAVFAANLLYVRAGPAGDQTTNSDWRGTRLLAGLGLVAPSLRAGPFLLGAPLLAALLHPLAHRAMALVPSTGEAPLETFISWPSGALCFALIGMAVPCAEELFFRGFVYGALRRYGVALAYCASVLLFALAHAQQSFGNWGALVAVTLTGLAMTAARALTGSTLVPMVAHVLYNASLWQSSFG